MVRTRPIVGRPLLAPHQPIGSTAPTDRLMAVSGPRTTVGIVNSLAARIVRLSLRTLWDIVLYLLGVLLTFLSIEGVPGATSGPGLPTDLGIVVLLLACLLWLTVFLRRRFPVVPLVAGALLTLVGMDYWLVLIGAFHALARLRGWPAIAAAAGAGVLVVFATVRDLVRDHQSTMIGSLFGVAGTPDTPGSGAVAAIVVLIVAAMSVGTTGGLALLVRSRRETATARTRVEAVDARNADLSSELARTSERDRLATEIHDALAHRLSVISLQSGALETATHTSDPALAHAARVLRGQAHASLEDLRGLLGDLRTGSPASSTGPTEAPATASMRALPRLVRSLREAGTAVDAVVLLDGTESAPAALDRSIYRIAQESLTNALKHAPGAPISLYVEGAPGSDIRIRVSNPIGGPVDPVLQGSGAGSGIAGIRERVRLLSGASWIGVHEDCFVVDATLPWPIEAAQAWRGV